MKKLLIIALVLLLLAAAAAFIVYKYVYNKPHPDYEKARAEVSVQAETLWTDFTMNKENADEMYTGKMVALEGMIDHVEEVDDMIILVYVFNQGIFGDEGIRVSMLPQFQNEALEISPSGPVNIKGLCTGYNGIDVIIEKGSIVGTQ